MKSHLLTSFSLVLIVIFALPGCYQNPEKDAVKLADIHKQKNEKVRDLLRCRDARTRIVLFSELRILESKYHQQKQQCETKYADTLEKRKFEEAFMERLKK